MARVGGTVPGGTGAVMITIRRRWPRSMPTMSPSIRPTTTGAPAELRLLAGDLERGDHPHLCDGALFGHRNLDGRGRGAAAPGLAAAGFEDRAVGGLVLRDEPGRPRVAGGDRPHLDPYPA